MISSAIPNDERWMLHAIVEGRRAQGSAYPNPPAGCILVANGQMLAAGHTQAPAEMHAERMCLDGLQSVSEGAILYLTLEPCAPLGSCPGCADIILDCGIKEVVVGIPHPNPILSGKGVAALQAGGATVRVGVQEAIIRQDLAEYIWRIDHGLVDGFKDHYEAQWERHSQDWLVHRSESKHVYHGIYEHCMVEALGSLDNKHVLVVGGGDGFLTRCLQDRGARTTYIDRSATLTRTAQEASTSAAHRYIHADALDVLPLPDQVDVVVCNMMLHCIETLNPYLKCIYESLRPAGLFYATVLHPCFKAPVHGWIFDKEGTRLAYRTDRYGNIGLLLAAVTGGGPSGIPTFNFHRRVSHYLNEITAVGFRISQVFEPQFEGDLVHEIPFEFQDDYFRRAPVFGWLATRPA